jgi:hypothetical protein
MVNQMKTDESELGVSVARRQLETLDKELAEILRKRNAVAHYISVMTGETIDPPSAMPGTVWQQEESRAEAAPRMSRAYPSRQYNKRVVDEALEIIARKGKPMTAPEIHLEHSMAEEIGTEAMYRLIYNRVIAGSLYSLAGAFWPVDQPIPDGWDVSLAKRKPSAAKQGAAGRR